MHSQPRRGDSRAPLDAALAWAAAPRPEPTRAEPRPPPRRPQRARAPLRWNRHSHSFTWAATWRRRGRPRMTRLVSHECPTPPRTRTRAAARGRSPTRARDANSTRATLFHGARAQSMGHETRAHARAMTPIEPQQYFRDEHIHPRGPSPCVPRTLPIQTQEIAPANHPHRQLGKMTIFATSESQDSQMRFRYDHC